MILVLPNHYCINSTKKNLFCFKHISYWQLFIARVREQYLLYLRENIYQEKNNINLNQLEPKLYPWKAQSRIRASAPIQSDQRAESEPEL